LGNRYIPICSCSQLFRDLFLPPRTAIRLERALGLGLYFLLISNLGRTWTRPVVGKGVDMAFKFPCALPCFHSLSYRLQSRLAQLTCSESVRLCLPSASTYTSRCISNKFYISNSNPALWGRLWYQHYVARIQPLPLRPKENPMCVDDWLYIWVDMVSLGSRLVLALLALKLIFGGLQFQYIGFYLRSPRCPCPWQ
jgi:hypothetical protein